MSNEIPRARLYSRLISDVQAVIQPSWEQFEQETLDPRVQAFCSYEERYRSVETDWGLSDEAVDLPTLFEFNPSLPAFEPLEAAQLLDRAYQRTDGFLQDIVQAYCERKRMPLPEATDAQALGSVVLRVMGGGISKVYEYWHRSASYQDEELATEHEAQYAYLPATLLLLGGRLSSAAFYEEIQEGVVEQTASQAEVDAAIDVALQQACSKIVRNEKLATSKSSPAGERIFAATMNCLRTLYHQGKEIAFQDQLKAWFFYPYMPDIDPKTLPGGVVTEEIRAARWFENLAQELNPLFGTTFAAPASPVVMVEQYRRTHKLADEITTELSGVDADDNPVEIPEDEERFFSAPLLRKIFQTRMARQLVEAIASGELQYSQIMRTMMMLREQPLASGAYESADQDTDGAPLPLEWEHIEYTPADKAERAADTSPGKSAPLDVDWARLDRLAAFVQGWGSEVSFARTKIPGLPPAKQYYVAILPEVLPDGTVLQHTLNDRPEYGSGLYGWRAERGTMRGPNGTLFIMRSWEDIFGASSAKRVWRSLGARCFYHTDGLEMKVLDFMTAPYDQVAVTHRYAIGQTATRIVRIAHPEDEE